MDRMVMNRKFFLKVFALLFFLVGCGEEQDFSMKSMQEKFDKANKNAKQSVDEAISDIKQTVDAQKNN